MLWSIEAGPLRLKQLTNILKIRILSETIIIYLCLHHACVILFIIKQKTYVLLIFVKWYAHNYQTVQYRLFIKNIIEVWRNLVFAWRSHVPVKSSTSYRPCSSVGRALDRWSRYGWFELALRHYFSSNNVRLLAYVFTRGDPQKKNDRSVPSYQISFFVSSVYALMGTGMHECTIMISPCIMFSVIYHYCTIMIHAELTKKTNRIC